MGLVPSACAKPHLKCAPSMDALDSFPTSISYVLSHFYLYTTSSSHWWSCIGFSHHMHKGKFLGLTFHQAAASSSSHPLWSLTFWESSMHLWSAVYSLHSSVSPSSGASAPTKPPKLIFVMSLWINVLCNFSYMTLLTTSCFLKSSLSLVSLTLYSLATSLTPLATLLSLLCGLSHIWCTPMLTDAPLDSVLGLLYSHPTQYPLLY